jgi:hypothetical protein
VKETRAELQETGIEVVRALGDGDRGSGSRAQGEGGGQVRWRRCEGMGTERGGRLDVGGCREPPRNARQRESTCILQKGMQTLLEWLR